MADRDDRERESRATGETRWEAAGEEEARRRHEAAERLKAEGPTRDPEEDDADEEGERARPARGA